MKKMILLALLLTAACIATYGQKVIAKGQTFTAMGDYRIESLDEPCSITGTPCQVYAITYANSPVEVKVIVCKTKNCKRYLVLSDKLSVQYVCNAAYFGVERLGDEFAKDGFVTKDENLNRMEYFHQKILGAGQKTELEATRYIAAYFPLLLKPVESYTAAM